MPFQPVLRRRQRHQDRSAVVDQQIDARVARGDRRPGASHRIQRVQVDRNRHIKLRLRMPRGDRVGRIARPLRIATGHDDRRAAGGQRCTGKKGLDPGIHVVAFVVGLPKGSNQAFWDEPGLPQRLCCC